MSTRILIVDDNPTFRNQFKTYLENNFFTVETVSDSTQTITAVADFAPDIVVLDVHMPRQDGLDVCRAIRAHPQMAEGEIGIIMVSGERRETIDQVTGLEIGADRYLTKPIDPRQLMAEIKALLRLLNRSTSSSQWLAIDDALRINIDERLVQLQQREVHLTKLEFDVLAYLALPPNKPRSRSELADEVWQEPIDDGPINRVMSALRKKIEPDPDNPRYIKTVYGIGYKLVATK